MSKLHKLIPLVLLLITIGCSGVQVSQDYDAATDFSGLNTFQWQSETQEKTGDVRVDNPLLNSRIRKAVERALTAKGYRKTVQRPPDFHISYKYTIRQKIATNNVSTGFGFGFGRHGRYSGIGVGTGADVRSYDEGMLVIDVYDAGGSTLMWRGNGTREVWEHSAPKEITKEVNETVEKILGQFPPLQ